jgi:flagellar biosynthetic protein FliQ
MSEGFVIGIIRDALQTGILVAAPILLVSLIIGLAISVFQATTQIQEQTLTFVPKLIGGALVGLLMGNWMLHQLVNFTQRIFIYIAHITQ